MSLFKWRLLLITWMFCAIIEGRESSCSQIWSRYPSYRNSNGIYSVEISGQMRQVYCDMANGGWTLVARFSNADDRNWIMNGDLWYDRTDELGAVTDPTVNADAMSAAFFGVTATELRITRSDSASHDSLLTTTNNCLQGQSVRDKIASFGNFRSGVWAANQVRGTCSAIFENDYQNTSGFGRAGASGCEIGDQNGISFFSDWSEGDGAVIMIGGGGTDCGRADHGIGITEANEAQFGLSHVGAATVAYLRDFGNDHNSAATTYSLNMWVRNDVQCPAQWAGATQIYCNGNCGTWLDEVAGCQQSDADAYCKLKTCDENAVAISFQHGIASTQGGFACDDRGTNYGDWFGMTDVHYDDNIQNTHGSGPVLNNIVCDSTTDDAGLGHVDYTTCQWHQLNKMNKVINSENFFGFECPVNQIISDLRLQGYASSSVLSNNPTAVLCCELGGYSAVTNTCVDSFSSADGNLEAAICEGNSALVAIYDLVDPTLQQSQWQYQATNGITCCDIEYDTDYGRNLNLGIDRSQCEVLSHSNPIGSFDLSCPMDMVLVEIMDNDPAHGVQEVHQIECCRVINFEAPSQAPTQSPTTSLPTQAPTTACYDCLIDVHGNISDQDTFVNQINNCLSLCCVA